MDGTEQGCPALVRQPKAQCPRSVTNRIVAPRTPRYGLPAVIAWRPSLIGYRLSAIGYRLSPLASRAIAPAAGPGAAPWRPYTWSSHVQRATFNLQPLAPLAPPRPTACRGRWHGTAPQDPHTAAIPPASGCAAGGDRLQRSGPPGATTRPAPCYPHSR